MLAAMTTRATTLAALIGLLVLAAAAAACGGSASPTVVPTPRASPLPTVDQSSPSPEPETFTVLDACVVLTQKDAEVIAQTPLETGQPGNPLEPSCVYTGPVTGPLAQVSIFIGDGAKKTYDIDVVLKHEFKPVPGLGDEAYAENNAIFFRKGTTWVAIELVRLNDPAANVKLLQDAAKTVAAALP